MLLKSAMQALRVLLRYTLVDQSLPVLNDKTETDRYFLLRL